MQFFQEGLFPMNIHLKKPRLIIMTTALLMVKLFVKALEMIALDVTVLTL